MIYCPPGYADIVDSEGQVVEGEWREHADLAEGLQPVLPTHARNFTVEASNVKNGFASFFMSEEGSVTWQWNLPGLLGVQDD